MSSPGDPRARVGRVEISSPRKVLDRPSGLTKLGLAHYFEAVAEWMLPHVADRALTLLRCPDGREEGCFFHKHPGRSIPDAVHVVQLPEKRGRADYMFVDDVAGLVSLAQVGALELHTWGSRVDRPDRPDRIVFDLDPGEGTSFADVIAAARDLRRRLAALDLESSALVTGSKGVHVVVAIERRHDFDTVHGFAAALARRMANEAGDRYVAEAAKSLRRGRVFIDYLRNSRGATAVCPYSPRARAGAPVAVPVRWRELDADRGADGWDTASVRRRLARLRSPPWPTVSQRLTRAAIDAVA